MSSEIEMGHRARIADRLAAIEAEIEALSDETAVISPDVSIGRLSRLDAMQHQQIALAGKRRLEDERNRLHEAIRRLDTGTYGSCLICGGEIALERLTYQPDAFKCVPCQQKKK
ncbi:TraR/DksA family transcriptional regulator [Synoicihabitans lomoniglobus]|uniref:TraR/DksA C4-type zinc finger protein n=1 Tax=Synoicihabitans lomoniglobus TaxID=2909285 RepID=A0AAF0CRQ5_9BACT|nr:TraR/DksA C4-type zinc finger protein [Opitutaceae bacterium LMO-M01]WED66860.1 TraR/DksA C4-type zinc finger protein [Opitutaceae bacterium LMO-M01]